MLFYLITNTVMKLSPITSMLYANGIDYARRSRASHELRRSKSKKAKLEELSSNLSDRSEAQGTAILSDLLVRSRRRVTGKSGIKYIIIVLIPVLIFVWEKTL